MLNPVLGFESYYAQIPRTVNPKSVLVIGGGAAGMEAARVAAEKGHKVTLAETSDALGGQLKYAASAPHKEELSHIIEFYEYQLEVLGVEMCLNTMVDRNVITQLNPDVVILATGAEAVIPSIPGLHKTNIKTAKDILENRYSLSKKSVTVIGGGSVGAEIAEMLALQKNKVTIIEKKSAIAEDLGIIMSLDFHDRLDELPIDRVTEATVERIEENKVFYTKVNGEIGCINTDAVVLAVGYASNRILESILKDMVNHVVMIGDCVTPRKIVNAIHEGFHAARVIE
jgi:NADPH-dependent 2,4-dienoyl-CoA reductase/sulfur reductase-like enzyme